NETFIEFNHDGLSSDDILNLNLILKSIPIQEALKYANCFFLNIDDELKIFVFKEFDVNIVDVNFLVLYLQKLNSISQSSEIELIFSKLNDSDKFKVIKSLIELLGNKINEYLYFIYSILISVEISDEYKLYF